MMNDSVIDAVSISLSSAKTTKNSAQRKTETKISREIASTLVRNARRGEAAKILKKLNIRRRALRHKLTGRVCSFSSDERAQVELFYLPLVNRQLPTARDVILRK